jgi:hypothetical protein
MSASGCSAAQVEAIKRFMQQEAELSGLDVIKEDSRCFTSKALAFGHFLDCNDVDTSPLFKDKEAFAAGLAAVFPGLKPQTQFAHHVRGRVQDVIVGMRLKGLGERWFQDAAEPVPAPFILAAKSKLKVRT